MSRIPVIIGLMENKQTVETLFDVLFKRYEWVPIPNCPGRFVLSKQHQKDLSLHSPLQVIQGIDPGIAENILNESFHTNVCVDPVIIVFETSSETGLLSYKKNRNNNHAKNSSLSLANNKNDNNNHETIS